MRYLIPIIVSLITTLWVYFFLENTYESGIGSGEYTSTTLSPLQAKKKVDLKNYGLKDLENELVLTVDQVKENVVSIIASKDFIIYEGNRAAELVQQQTWWGSGILLDSSWYILTNKHVISDPETTYTIIFSDGQAAEVESLWLDESLDIALLKVSEKEVWSRSPARLVDFSTPIVVGQFAIAIWNALAEFQNSVTFWVISGNNRKLELDSSNVYAWLLQTDTSISEGNSGGPLFNMDGEVIWINTAVSSFGENIWFAIPLTQQFVQATIQSVKNNNKIVRPFVWVRYVDISTSIAQEYQLSTNQWIYVAEVLPWSPAEEVNLLPEDVITHIDDVPIDQQRTFLYQLYTKIPGDKVKLRVMRDGEELEVSMVLGK